VNPLAAIIFGATIAAVIARQLLFRGPPVWVVFLAGAFAMVATGVLPLAGASTALSTNLPVLVFLFSLFILAAGLEQSGALDHLARWAIGRARSPAELPLVLFVALGTLSAFIVNDALVLVGVPLLFAVARRLRVSALPLLLTLAFSVSVGSVLTPFGNPQNLLVSLGSGLTAPVSTFLRYLLLPTAMNLLVGGFYLRKVFGPHLTPETAGLEPPERVPFLPPSGLGGRVGRFPTLLVFPVTVIAMITSDVTSAITQGPPVPLYAIALGGAVVALVLTPGRSELFARVDWSILVLFAALFVVVAGVVKGGVLTAVASVLPIPGPGHSTTLIAILLTSLGGSQLVSNVPWVGLQIPVMHALGYGSATPSAWVALAAGSTLAGNVTLLGAASNLIVVEQAQRAGVRIGLREFVRVGAPLAAATTGILFVALWFGV
jgi:Na+/H+ antiporter NhaD/arsenite permease-like protein